MGVSQKSLLFYGRVEGGTMRDGFCLISKVENLSTQMGYSQAVSLTPPVTVYLVLPSLNLIPSLPNKNSHTLQSCCKIKNAELLAHSRCSGHASSSLLPQPAGPKTLVLVARGRYSARPLTLYTGSEQAQVPFSYNTQ